MAGDTFECCFLCSLSFSLPPCFLNTSVVSFPGKLPWSLGRPGHSRLHHTLQEPHFCAWNCTGSTVPTPTHIRSHSSCAHPLSGRNCSHPRPSHQSQGQGISASCVRPFTVLPCILFSLCDLSPSLFFPLGCWVQPFYSAKLKKTFWPSLFTWKKSKLHLNLHGGQACLSSSPPLSHFSALPEQEEGFFLYTAFAVLERFL